MAAGIDQFTERERAYHEAAHAVLAALLGVDVRRVSIVPVPAARSQVKLAPHPGLAPAEELVVLLAGEEAQRRLGAGDAADAPMATGDRERARQVLDTAGIDEGQGRSLMSDGQERARQLLGEAPTWRQVEAVAAALLAEGTLDGGRFRDLLASA